eukprot:g7842.t1
MPCPPAVEAAINNVEETDDADINDLMDNFNGMQVDLTTEECEDDALDRAGVGDNDSEFDEEENREQEDEAAGKEGEEGDEGDGDEGNGMSAATIQESSTDETVKKLPKYSFLKEEYSLPPSNPVYVVFDIETNGISSMLNKRMCSIAAQVFDKDGVLISVDTKSDFNSKIQIDRKMHPKWGTGIHGMTYKELEKERLFGPVFDSFLAFIEARRGASSEVVLVAHNGVTCDFRLLLVEMARHERVFPATLNIHLYDTYAAIKKCKANKSLDYWTASVEDWPKRGAKSKGYMEHGTPKMQVPCIVNFILKKRAKFAPNEDTFESYCGAAHDALADVKGLALITFDPEGLRKKIKLKHYYGPLVVGHLLEYADKLIKHENFVEADPCMQGWTEKKEDEEGCPLEEKEDPDFTPKEGCAENGGPSRLLREYMGMGEGDKYAPCTSYLKLLALWSFELVGGGNPGDPIRKFRRFDLMVMARIQEAWDIEAHITLDEARIKMFSKFCPFTWTMMCKPIRHGCTVYVLAFPESGYVYGWVWWTGKGMAKTHGQPTDQRAVNEDETSGEHGFMRILIETLFTEEDFWHTQIMTWMDKAFTSNANCRWFDDHGMGNAGPCRAFRPKNMKKTPEYYWAFGEDFSKKGGREQRYEKGWYRIAYTKLPSGNYLSNIAWLDNRFVTFVSNRLHDCSPDQVKRWSRANRKREWRKIHRAIKMYGEKMGAVDGVNQAAAKADCTVPRAQLNFYRKMGAKTVDTCRHNAIAAAASLYQGYDALRKSKKWKGWPTFANISLATALLNMGIQMDKDALGTADVREREGLVPAWMNGRSGMKKRHRSDAPAPVKRRAVVHEWVDLKTIVLEWDQSRNPTKYHPPQGRCRGCLNNAGKGKANSVKRKCKGCKQCKVALCEECHKDSTKWNHQSKRAPPVISVA